MTTEQTTTEVIGLIYAHGKKDSTKIPSLEDLYWYIMDLYVDVDSGINVQTEQLPYYLELKDGTILPYVHEFFYRAFILGSFNEAELREALEFSGI